MSLKLKRNIEHNSNTLRNTFKTIQGTRDSSNTDDQVLEVSKTQTLSYVSKKIKRNESTYIFISYPLLQQYDR